MKYLVDSDYVVDYLKNREYAVRLIDKMLSARIGVSIITYAEVYEGIYYGRNRVQHEEGFRQFLQGVSVLSITRPIAQRFAITRGELRAKGQLIGLSDILIAATAIHHNLTLVTRNIKHYNRIPDLKLYQVHSHE